MIAKGFLVLKDSHISSNTVCHRANRNHILYICWVVCLLLGVSRLLTNCQEIENASAKYQVVEKMTPVR